MADGHKITMYCTQLLADTTEYLSRTAWPVLDLLIRIAVTSSE